MQLGDYVEFKFTAILFVSFNVWLTDTLAKFIKRYHPANAIILDNQQYVSLYTIDAYLALHNRQTKWKIRFIQKNVVYVMADNRYLFIVNKNCIKKI